MSGGSFYPSCVVNMTMRFDEALRIAEDADDIDQDVRTLPQSVNGDDPAAVRRRGRIPQVTIGTATGSGGGPTVTMGTPTGQSFDSKTVTMNSPRVTMGRAFGVGYDDEVGGRALVPLTYGSDGFTVITSRVPIKGTFTLPHPRKAATFNMEFDYREFPVDPRVLRAVGLEIHLGTVTADNYARGIAGERDASGRPLSIINTKSDLLDPFTGKPAVDGNTLVFFATVDEWTVEHNDSGSRITLSGRDVRGIFLDAKIKPARIAKIDPRKTIDHVVADIIATIPAEYDLNLDVMTNAAEWPDGIVPSPGDVDGLTRVSSGASGKDPKAAPANGTKASYWDLITNYCGLVGGVPYLHESAIWIRPARSIFDIVTDRSIDTPFPGGVPRIVGNEEIRVRRLIWGRDITKLSFTRKFAGAVVPTIKTVAIDDRVRGMQRLLQAQWPPKTSTPAKAKADTEVMVIPVPGVRSLKRLEQIAHDIYEEVGRGEMGGTIETSNLASFGGDNSDPDLLRIRPTDPIEILVDARRLSAVSPVVSELNDAQRRTFEEEVDILVAKLGDRDIARALVASARNIIVGLLSFYQVSEVRLDWHVDTGVKIGINYQNYIVSRHGGDRTHAGRPAPDIKRRRVSLVGAHKKATARVGKKPTVVIGVATGNAEATEFHASDFGWGDNGGTRTGSLTSRVGGYLSGEGGREYMKRLQNEARADARAPHRDDPRKR